MVSGPLPIVGYRRVSTEDQKDKGSSLEAQTEKIRAYAKSHHYELVGIEDDGGESGKSLDRPGVRRCLAMLEAGTARGVIVANLDRLTRHVGDLVELVERHFLEPGGAVLVSASEPIETRTAQGRMTLYILAVFSQFMREQLVEKTAGVMSFKRRHGERTGNLRFGTKLDPSDPRRGKKDQPIALVDSDEDRATEALIVQLRAGGVSLQRIADELNARAIPAKRGVTKRSTGRWAKSSVHEILKRAGTGPRGDHAEG